MKLVLERRCFAVLFVGDGPLPLLPFPVPPESRGCCERLDRSVGGDGSNDASVLIEI